VGDPQFHDVRVGFRRRTCDGDWEIFRLQGDAWGSFSRDLKYEKVLRIVDVDIQEVAMLAAVCVTYQNSEPDRFS
jgi:hypothetical protein